MTTTRAKRAAPKVPPPAPGSGTSTTGSKAPAHAPLVPVSKRIGEGSGNLQARGEAFKRRHRSSK
jgi:hypothetical protein